MMGPVSLLVQFTVAIGAFVGRLLPFTNCSGLFFFFPFYHTGGAEKVHADIVACCGKERPGSFLPNVRRTGPF